MSDSFDIAAYAEDAVVCEGVVKVEPRAGQLDWHRNAPLRFLQVLFQPKST